MTRLIDAEILFEKVGNIKPKNKSEYELLGIFMNMITYSPTVEERTHGKWVLKEASDGKTVGICSECKSAVSTYESIDAHKFCWNCGADMRQKTCGNCYWFSKVTVPCCEQDKEPTTENEKACDRWEEGEAE